MPNIPHPAEELITTGTAAKIVDVVPDTFRLWQRLGKISPAFLTPTGVRLYRRADIELIAAQRRLAQAEQDPSA